MDPPDPPFILMEVSGRYPLVRSRNYYLGFSQGLFAKVCLVLAFFFNPEGGLASAPPSKLEKQVNLFQEEPVPGPGGILLVGSSIFRQWKNAAVDLAPLPVTNRAFGGSHTSHQIRFFDQVVPPCRPDLVVWYCGSNDIKGGKDPATVLARTREWIGKVQSALPGSGVLLVSVMNSPQKRRDGQAEGVLAVNCGLREMANPAQRIFFIEINPGFEGADGSARADLYLEDGLHLNAEGYRELARLLRPVIEQHWKPKG